MSDSSKPKSESTLSWQEASKADDQQELRASRDPNVNNNADAETLEGDLVEQASKFLEHDEIKDASNERKTEFLKKKGLPGDEIQKLLRDSRDPPDEETESNSTPREGALARNLNSEPQFLD